MKSLFLIFLFAEYVFGGADVLYQTIKAIELDDKSFLTNLAGNINIDLGASDNLALTVALDIEEPDIVEVLRKMTEWILVLETTMQLVATWL